MARAKERKTRAISTNSYDDQGRVYESRVYSVASDGTISGSYLATDTFYDHAGNVIATYAPGGLVTKDYYDGVGRVTTQFTNRRRRGEQFQYA